LKAKYKITKNDALIVVDVQRDFCPGGALPVRNGDKVVPPLNKYMKMFQKATAKIFATRDWHPRNHISFKAYGGIWPPHCIQQSTGAEFHPDLQLPQQTQVISKATDPLRESYSGFDGTELKTELEKEGVKRVFVGGLATDYCVKNTVLDALKLGFKAVLLTDATRGINQKPKDSEEAIAEMVRQGAKRASLSEISEPFEAPSEVPNMAEEAQAEHLRRDEKKKKARLRTRGPYRKGRIETYRH
jgi:nicotinamidase/pyrazinamidase